MNSIRSYSYTDAAKFAFNTLKHHYKTFLKLIILYIPMLQYVFYMSLPIIRLAELSPNAFANNPVLVCFLIIIASLCMLLAAFLFSYWYVWSAKICYLLYDNNIDSILAVRPAKRAYFHQLKTSFVVFFMTVVGFILLIIPGFIILFRYGFAPIRSLESFSSVKDTLKFSRKITAGNIWFIISQLGTGMLCIWLFLFTIAFLQVLLIKAVVSVSNISVLLWANYILSVLGWAVSWFFGVLVWVYVYRRLKDNYERTVEQENFRG